MRPTLLGLLLTVLPAQAMLSNLERPYESGPSRPHDSRLVFWSPDRSTLLFNNESEIVLHCRAGLRSVGLKWRLSRNLFKTPFATGEAEALPANEFKIRLPTAGLIPGFYDLRVELDSGDAETIKGVCTFGYRINEMAITPDRPADFIEFWKRGMAELAAIPLDPKLGPLETFGPDEINAYNLAHAAIPADYDPSGHRAETVESGKWSVATRNGERVYGWLAKPPGQGPFPAMLILPGGGFNARPRPLEHARHGYLALDIQVHGQDVDQAEYAKLDGYFGAAVYEPVDAFYYYKVYLNALQALRYLLTRDDVDRKKIVLVGGSQGGRLAVVLAALEPQVKAIVAGIPFAGNQPYATWAQSARAPVTGMDQPAPPPLRDTPENRCVGYYDPMSFAPDVKAAVLMNAGLIDPISPPSSAYGIFRELGTSRKEFIPLPGLGHDWSAEFDRRAWRWLDEILNGKSAQPKASASPAAAPISP